MTKQILFDSLQKVIMSSLGHNDIDPNVNNTEKEDQTNNLHQLEEAVSKNENKVIQTENSISTSENWTIIDKEEVGNDINEDIVSRDVQEKQEDRVGDLMDSSRESDTESIEVISEDEFSTSSTSYIHLPGEISILKGSFSFPSSNSSRDEHEQVTHDHCSLDDASCDDFGQEIGHMHAEPILENIEPEDDDQILHKLVYDDALSGAPFLPLDGNKDLYPSQEVDKNCSLIGRIVFFKQNRNFFLSGVWVVLFAMVFGLGLRQFLDFAEHVGVQKVKIETFTDQLSSCMMGEEGMKSYIGHLREENEQLRNQLENMQGEETMVVNLKNIIKSLVTENADLEGEVARLRIVENKFENIPDSDESNEMKGQRKFENALEEDVVNFIIDLQKNWEEMETQWKNIDANKHSEQNSRSWNQEKNITKRMERNSYNDWISKRGEGRKKWRVSNGQADWLFDRARFRRDIRHEEKRSEWYFENKQDYRKMYY